MTFGVILLLFSVEIRFTYSDQRQRFTAYTNFTFCYKDDVLSPNNAMFGDYPLNIDVLLLTIFMFDDYDVHIDLLEL